jgi:hypothetical protein
MFNIKIILPLLGTLPFLKNIFNCYRYFHTQSCFHAWFVVSRVCRVQGLSVQGLYVQGLSVQGLSVYRNFVTAGMPSSGLD